MTPLTEVNTAMRQRVAHLEHRFGRRRLYLATGVIALLLIIFFVRFWAGRKKPASSSPPRTVVVAKVITRDVRLCLDAIGTCTSVDSLKAYAQVSGQITARGFQAGGEVKRGDRVLTF